MPEINRILIAGTGTMGRGLAELFLSRGAHVTLYNPRQESVSTAATKITANLKRKGAESVTGLYVTWSVDGLQGDYHLVLEAIPESYPLKLEFWREVSAVVGPKTLCATGTSSLSVTRLAEAFMPSQADRLVGMHFFNPPTKMRLVEVVPGLNTGKDTVRRACEFAEAMGRRPIVINDSPGFAVNRILLASINQAVGLVESCVATAEQIDECMELGCNHPMGPLKLADYIGLDVVVSILDAIAAETSEPQYVPKKLLRRLVSAGNLGKKTGRGFLRYDQPLGDGRWAYNRDLYCNHD